ncbi:MAG: hypothetical protein AAF721_13680 [Myxococcota bacterium]
MSGCYDGGPQGNADTEAAGTGGTGADDGAGTADDDGPTAGGGSAGDDDDPDSGTIPDPPPDCFPGAVGCECLDGNCEGLSTCEDNVCIPGPPVPEVDGDGQAIAGLAIELNGDIDDDPDLAGFDQLQWTQVDGPDATIAYEFGTQAVAYLPEDAETGMEFTFRLSASLGDVMTSADYSVTILAATAIGPMDEAAEVIALGGASFIPRGGNDYWIATPGGNLAQIDDNAISGEYDLMSPIADVLNYDGGLILVTQPDIQTVTAFNVNNLMPEPFLTELSGGAALGGVGVLAVDGDDNVYIGTAENDIVYYDSPDGAEPATSTVMESMSVTPTALALGDVPVPPDIDEGDEGNVLYVGASDGDVWQIGLSAAEDGSPLDLGNAVPYLSVPGSGPVTGLSIDGVGNMWVGKSSGLYLVRRQNKSAPSVVRTISPTAGLQGFSGLRVDDGGLVWIDPGSGRVGEMITGQ